MKYKILFFLFIPLFAFASSEAAENVDLFNRDNAGFFVSGEFLYWTVSEGALDYALRMRSPAWGSTDSFAQGDFERAEFSWDPGYRFVLGYYRAPNFWMADFDWTYIHFKNHDQAKRPPKNENRFMTGTWPHIFSAPMEHATSDIHLHYELANLLAHRVFFPINNPHLRMKLFGGLTGVWIHQGWKVRYFDFERNNTMINNHWKYWGFGFRGGLSFDWFWGRDIYVTGKCSGALVLGHYKNHAKQETNVVLNPGDNPAVPLRDARYTDYRSSFTAQLLLGPSYQKSFAKWRLEIFVGYEMTIWTNLQEVFRSTRSPADQAKETWLNNSLIAIHGLSTRASFNF